MQVLRYLVGTGRKAYISTTSSHKITARTYSSRVYESRAR